MFSIPDWSYVNTELIWRPNICIARNHQGAIANELTNAGLIKVKRHAFLSQPIACLGLVPSVVAKNDLYDLTFESL